MCGHRLSPGDLKKYQGQSQEPSAIPSEYFEWVAVPLLVVSGPGADGQLTHVNGEARRFFAEIPTLPAPVSSLLPKALRQKLDGIWAAFQVGTPQVHRRIAFQDGERRHVEMDLVARMLAPETLLLTLIPPRRGERAQGLGEGDYPRDMLQSALDSLPYPIWIRGLPDGLHLINRAYQEVLGPAAPTPEASQFWEGVGDIQRHEAQARWQAGISRPGFHEIQVPMETRQGLRHMVISELPLNHLKNAGQSLRVGMIFDVTDLKASQLELMHVNMELTRNNMELQQFSHAVSHDLQEPLRMIGGFCQLLKRRYAGQLDDQANQWIDFAVEGAERMQILIRDLLSYSRLESRDYPMQPVDMGQILVETLDNLQLMRAERQARIHAEPLPVVQGEPTQILQLMQNLVSNALKFCDADRPTVHIAWEEGDGEWLFTVRDNGIGMAADDLHRIFDVFTRLHGKKRYEGSGIGLAICRRVVERHGGKIWAQSTPGEGSLFSFTLKKWHVQYHA